MKKIGILGYGKIGRAVMAHILQTGHQISFLQDTCTVVSDTATVVEKADESMLQQTDVVVECATPDALKKNFDQMIQHADMLIFSLTAFSDETFYHHAIEMAKTYGHHIYFPHGAILGLDGITDARSILTKVSIETIKSPKSLGLSATQRTVVYEGSTREACQAFPRNVNVHAAVAMAGIGFDQTVSTIVADPAVDTNSHLIVVHGDGVNFTIEVSSTATGGVTGLYTPLSACGSIDRVLNNTKEYSFL